MSGSVERKDLRVEVKTLILEQARLELPREPKPIVMIGAGGIVKDAHLPAYRKAGFVVSGIFDIAGERARQVAGEFGIPNVHGNLDQAVAEAPEDAVFDVAVPPAAIPSVIEQIPGGRGVLIQKPMGQNIEEARRIREVCREKRFTAALNFQLRYAPVIMAARGMIREGLIGDIHDMEVRVIVSTPWHLWEFLNHVPRVEILHHSIHYLDLIRSFLGNPDSVYAKTVNHPFAPKLSSTKSMIILNYGESVLVSVTTNHHHDFGTNYQESYVKWEGAKGAIKATLGALMDYPKGTPDRFEYCLTGGSETPRWETAPVKGSWFPDAFIGPMSSLMRFMEGSTSKLPTSVEDSYQTMALVEAAYESSDTGGTKVSYD